jgi:DNA helicase HerA-like ATPase
MKFTGRPLFDNPLDVSLFAKRPEAARLEANCRDGINTLVFGDPGSGKTSLLRYVLFQLRESDFPAVAVDAAPAEDPLELLRLIAASLGRVQLSGGRPISPAMAGLGRVGSVLAEIHALRPAEESAGPRTAVLIDLPPGARTVHELFGRFRDELWQLPYTWVVVAPKQLRIDLLTPPANAFFEDVIKLESLTPSQQEELVALRLEPDEQTPWRLPADEENSPRRLLEIVRESIRDGESPDRRFEARAKRETEVASLGRAASMLYAELENYGPASASDEELRARLGWSRQRAAQVFAELEGEDFVRAEYRPAASGRPRKVFVIAPPSNS